MVSLPTYIVPLINDKGVIKLKYDVKRGKGVSVLLNIPAMVGVVTSEKEIRELAKKKDVEVME